MAEFKEEEESYFDDDVLSVNKFNIDFNNLSDQNIALKLLEKCFKKYPLVRTSDDGIYRFYGVYWKKVELKNTITPEKHFNLIHQYYTECINSIRSDIDDKSYKQIINKINKMQSHSYQTTLTRMINRIIYRKDVIWNNYPHLLTFEDGILNLDTNDFLEPSENLKQYYINMSCGYKV